MNKIELLDRIKNLNIIRDKKIFLKKISLLICCIVIVTLMNIPIFTVKADVPSKPEFKVSIDSYEPKSAKIGEDITVHGTITPQPFEISIPSKEIILVLDTSASMKDDGATKCTNTRVRHWMPEQDIGGTPDHPDKRILAHWTDTYCEEHGKEGDHNITKLDELKIAAKNFIDTMKNEENLKIGIVTFSTDSYIKMKLTLASNTSELNAAIDNLKADGGTNTGEGLRKAAYELSNSSDQDSTANKTIVFMSDGEPTFYNWESNQEGWTWGNYNGTYYTRNTKSGKECYGYDGKHNLPKNSKWQGPYDGNYTGYKYKDSYNDYYTDITREDVDGNVRRYGTGYSDDNGYCLNYPKTMGAIIKAKGYNVFSIGYGLDDSGNKKMKQIHNSMSGTSDNFFATDKGAIDSVFKKIATEIKESYPITDADFNFNPEDGTPIEVVGGNTIRLKDVVYKKDSKNNGKILYKSEPVPFTLTIKSNQYGDSIPVFTKSTITFTWNSETITANVPAINIYVKGDYVPNINAHLISPAPNTVVNQSQEIEVTYKIDPEPFEYNANVSSGPIDEAVFVVDETSKMNEGERYTNFKNGFDNSILDGSILGDRNIKFNVVGYNDSVNFPNNDDYNTLIGRKSDREKLRLEFENQITDQIKKSTSNNRNIEGALDRANKLLQEKGEQGKNKAIILVTSGDANYDSNSNIINTISKNGYKIISLDLSNTDGSQNNNLKTLHQLLSGKDEDYILPKADGGNYNTPEEKYAESIANKLLGGNQSNTSTNNIIIKGAKLNFDLGENFDAAANSGLNGTGKVRSVNIPDIIYTKDVASGKYVCQQESQSLEIKFKIKPTDGKKGKLGFAEDSETDYGQSLKNYISYNRLDGIETKKHIETPIVNIGVPNINAKLISASPNPANPGQEIDVTYQIDTDPFKYSSGNLSGCIDEAVFVVDLSHRVKTAGGDRMEIMSPWFEKILLNDEAGIFQSQNIKYSVVGYNGTEEYPESDGQYDKLFDPESNTEKGSLLTSISNMLSKVQNNNSDKKSEIGFGLEKADKILTDGVDNKRKAIVLVNCSDIDDSVYDDTIINTVKTNGYKIISLNMNWAPGQIKKSDLPYLHEALGGADSDYLISGAYNNGKGSAGDDMVEIAKRLNPGTSSSVVIQNAKLNFDLGGNFESYDDNGSSGLEGTGNARTISIPNIEYAWMKNDDGTYSWHQKQSIEKTFKIKSAPDKYGQLGFGFYANAEQKNSTISYTDLSGLFINKEINTPVIEVNKSININVEHGVYKGIDNNGVPDIGKPGGTFAKGSVVPMAASFNFNGNTEIQLTLGSKGLPGGDVKIKGDIIIYKADTNGHLTQIGKMNGSGSNYSGRIENLSVGDKILILYNAELPTIDGNYTNYIKVGNSEKIPAELTVGGELPDLF